METKIEIIGRQQAIIALNEKLSLLVRRGEAIEVKDASGDLQAKQYEVEVKSYFKAVDLFADGEIQDVKERLGKLTVAKKLLLAPLQAVYEKVRQLRRAWEENERKEAEKEASKLSKKHGQEIDVKPSIPTVAGVQSRRNWKFNVKDAKKVKREWMMPDYGRIGQKVRELQDKEKAEKLIGGIEVWSE